MRARVLVAGLIAVACRGGASVRTPEPECGAPRPLSEVATSPTPVIAAPEGGYGVIEVGERYVAQQSGTSVLVWDIVLGTPTSVTRDVRLLGVAPDADRFLVERDRRVVVLEPSGRFGEQVADRPVTDLRAVPAGGPARYVAVFHQTSLVRQPVWTTAHGIIETFHFSIGCPHYPLLETPMHREITRSADGLVGGVTTTMYNLNCGKLPARVLTWRLSEPAAVARIHVIPPSVSEGIDAALVAISNDGMLAVVRGLARDGSLTMLRLPRDGEAVDVVSRFTPANAESLVAARFAGNTLLTSSETSTQARDLTSQRMLWKHAGALMEDVLPDGSAVLLERDHVVLVDGETGRERWRHRREGRAKLSRLGTTIVIGPAPDGAFVVVDVASGRALRKIASVPLRRVAALAFTADGLVTSDGWTHTTVWSLEQAALRERIPYAPEQLTRERPTDFIAESTGGPNGTVQWRVSRRDGTRSTSLARSRNAPSSVLVSADGRIAVGVVTSQTGSDWDPTAIVLWDVTNGELVAEVSAPLDREQREELFRGAIGPNGFVSGEIVDAALSPDGSLIATAHHYVHYNKPNWSYETVEGHRYFITVQRTSSGERALPDLEGGDIVRYIRSDLLVTAGGRALRAYRGDVRVAEASFDGAVVVALAASADGQMLATAHADGVVRVWSADGLALRATLLDYRDDEWLVMTPGGAYVGTPEVGERVGWTYDAPLEPFGFEQFASTQQRADIVRQRLATGAGDIELPRTRPPSIALAESVPSKVGDDNVRVRVHVRSATRVDAVRFYVEGKPVAKAAPCGDSELETRIPLSPGPNRITVVAFDDRGLASNPLAVDVTRTTEAVRPDLWVLAVGIDRYPGLAPENQLEFAVADARSVADVFRAQAGPGRPFARAHVTLLEDATATPQSIVRGLDGLARMESGDVAIVFLAGHGIKHGDRGDMVFLTGGVRAPGGRLEQASSGEGTVSWAELGRRIDRAAGRILVLVDACHSGHIDQQLLAPNDDLARRLASSGRAGVVVFAAAKGRQLSYETHGTRGFSVDKLPAFADAKDGHGLFTAAMLKSLADRDTDRNGDGAVQLSELVDEVSWRVRRTTGEKQTPWVVRRELFGDFVLGVAGR